MLILASGMPASASFDDETVFHIVIPGEKPNTPITIKGKLSSGHIVAIAVWQIVNNNGTGECKLKLREFECTATTDPLMDAEITIDYEPRRLQVGCEYLPTQLEMEYFGERHVFLQAHEYPRPNCVLLPMLSR